MGETHASTGKGVYNWTYIENRDAGYPNGSAWDPTNR